MAGLNTGNPMDRPQPDPKATVGPLAQEPLDPAKDVRGNVEDGVVRGARCSTASTGLP